MTEHIRTTTQATALAELEQAYQDFLDTFAQVPNAALSFVPVGEEYTVGTLLAHLQDPLRNYTDVLQRILDADFGPVDQSADPQRAERDARRHAELAAMRPTGADRLALLAGLAEAHANAHAQIAALDEATFTRQAPVIYSAGSAPYPTSGADIVVWLVDHYHEHIAQTGQLLDAWRARHGV